MNPDEDEDTKKLVEVEKEAAGPEEHHSPVPFVSDGDNVPIKAGDRAGSSEKRKHAGGTPVKRKKPAQVEVIELSDDPSSGEDESRAKEEEEASDEEEKPPRKRKKQGGARKAQTRTKKAKHAKLTQTTSAEVVAEDAEETVKHTDGHGNEALTDFFKVEEKSST